MNELQTRDTAVAGKFYYEALFGWSVKTSPSALAGGMIKIQREWGDVPSNWAVYFAGGSRS